MKKQHTLRESLVVSNVLVSLIPLLFIAVVILLFMIHDKKQDFILRTDLVSKGIRGQIQLFMNQPLASLNMISGVLHKPEFSDEETITGLLNTHIRESDYFEAIYLLDATGKVINAGLPRDREKYRPDLLGIELGHKQEIQAARQSRQPVWSDTFLSLDSGTVSVSVYLPSGEGMLLANINLEALENFINQLSNESLITMVIDRNGAILFHPDPELLGKSIMMNNIDLVAKALQGHELTGQFTWRGKDYFGSTSNIAPIGWIALNAVPANIFSSSLKIPLLIFAGGIFAAVGLSLLLAYYRARKVARPLTEITLISSIIARGDYARPLPASDFEELQLLSDSINQMASAIQKREAELRDKELKYRELVESTSNLVLRLDRDLNITYANHALHKLTGIAAPGDLGLPLRKCIADQEWPAVAETLNDWISKRQDSGSIECFMEHPAGTKNRMLLAVNLHFDPAGALYDINIIGHDMTTRYQIEHQQKELEEKRQKSQKMELLGLMAGGVAHDLNNILSGIISFPEMLLMRLDTNDPMRGPLEMIKTSGERAAEVVADLLTIARGSAAVRQMTDLNQIIAAYCKAPEFIQLKENHPRIDFEFSGASDLWPCRCSPSHIEKTMMNLIINAFEAIEDAGRVTAETRNIGPGEIPAYSEDLPAGHYVAAIIRDSGTGISEEDLGRIFEPFFSKKGLGRSGTGLGLAVAWNSIREHDGTIVVSSSPQGTCFTVLLPAEQDHSILQTNMEKQGLKEGDGEEILVVDDEESLREIAVNMLKLLGYRATSVASGEAAIDYLRSNRADLVLLDMQMDPGMNGRETYARIKDLYPRQKALVATGYSTSTDVEATIQAGAAGFIKKPYHIQNLGEAVYRALHPESSAVD